MIITKLNGGLGNQLFEYAYARSIQLKNNDSLYLDIEGFKRSPRHFSLGNLIKAGVLFFFRLFQNIIENLLII